MTGIAWLEREVQQHEREYERYVEYQWAVDALNELDCAEDGFVSCEGYEAATDMVKVKWERWDEEKCGGPVQYENNCL